MENTNFPGNEAASQVNPEQNASNAASYYKACPAMYRPEVIREYSRREVIFAAASLAVGFMFIKLLVAPMSAGKGNMFGIGAAVTLLAATVCCTLFNAKCKKWGRDKVIRVALCIAFSINVFICSNTLIQFLDIVFVILCLAYDKLCDSDGKYGIGRKLFIADILSAVVTRPMSEAGALPGALKQAASRTKGGKTAQNLLLGLLIALPSTAAVCGLLMSADDGFSEIMNSLLSNIAENVFVFIFQAAVSIPAGCYIFGLCVRSSRPAEPGADEYVMQSVRSLRFLPAAAGAASAVPVCVLYVIFFFSQASYFLSAFASRLPGAVSYSEYARQGFFELCLVSVINLGIITAINIFCRYNEDGKRPVCIKILSCILSVFTLLLIATAVSKMVMYINVYGLTPLRVYTTWFMLLLAVVFAGIFLSLVTSRVNLPRLAVTAFTVMFAILSFSNAEGIIAGVNAQRYLSGVSESFDLRVIEDMSAAAVPAVNELRGKLPTKSENERLESILADKIYFQRDLGDGRNLTLSDIIAQSVLGK